MPKNIWKCYCSASYSRLLNTAKTITYIQCFCSSLTFRHKRNIIPTSLAVIEIKVVNNIKDTSFDHLRPILRLLANRRIKMQPQLNFSLSQSSQSNRRGRFTTREKRFTVLSCPLTNTQCLSRVKTVQVSHKYYS